MRRRSQSSLLRLTAAFVWIAGDGAKARARAHAQPAPFELAANSGRPLRPRPRLTRGRQCLARASARPTNRRRVQTWPARAPSVFAAGGWSEERVVVLGFFVLAALAGLIIFVASILDSFT